MRTKYYTISSAPETYDKNREFILTSSPSMDILISSNLERLIYRIAGESADENTKLMAALSTDGKYVITDEMKAQLSRTSTAITQRRKRQQT